MRRAIAFAVVILCAYLAIYRARPTHSATVLIAHNIDIAPRIDGLKTGAPVIFEGEYVWNAQGGVVHWTHHDPSGRHKTGFVKYDGRTYQ